MTDEELKQEKKRIKASIKRSEKWWNSLSDEEKKRFQDESESSRLWEDWTDTDEDFTTQSDKKQFDR